MLVRTGFHFMFRIGERTFTTAKCTFATGERTFANVKHKSDITYDEIRTSLHLTLQ